MRWHFDVEGSRLARYSRYLFALAILLATIRAGYSFAQVLLLETKGAINPDGVTYMIVGRGILNGLRPYADLFESKPPGIFLISALSLLTTGSERLALLLQVGLLIAIPVLLAVFAWREVRQKLDLSHRYLVIISATLIGLLLGLYLAERSGSFQPESFGAFFASLYILHVFVRRDASTISAIFLNACLLMASIGLKEPFVVTTLAGILLITRDRRHFFYAFLVPLAVAIVIGMGALLALGYLDPYLSIYLPAMLNSRIAPDPLEPLWVRGFAVGRLFGSLGGRFYPAHVFGGTFALLWILAPALKSQIRSAGRLLLVAVTSVTIYLALVNTRVFLVLLRAISRLPVNFENSWGFLGLHFGKYVLVLVACILLLLIERKKRILLGNIASFLALYLTSLTVGVADYLPWHWGFAFPVLFALAILFVRYAASQSLWSLPVVLVIRLFYIRRLFTSNGANWLHRFQ